MIFYTSVKLSYSYPESPTMSKQLDLLFKSSGKKVPLPRAIRRYEDDTFTFKLLKLCAMF